MTLDRDQIINNMCLTFRHDYGIVITEEDRMYSLAAGMTKREREALFNDMAQVFDHHFAHFATGLEEYRKINEGELITMPKSKEHAKYMILIAEHYLKSHE
jgi:hypothetical protein